MIPDLAGRWQTRVVIFLLAALLLTGLGLLDLAPGGDARSPLAFTGYWFLIGLLFDPAYQRLQGLRREGDWPFLHGVAGLALEALATYGAMVVIGLPGLPACLVVRQDLALKQFVCALPSIGPGDTLALILWLAGILVLVQSAILPVLVPRWRFDGWRVVRGRRRP